MQHSEGCVCVLERGTEWCWMGVFNWTSNLRFKRSSGAFITAVVQWAIFLSSQNCWRGHGNLSYIDLTQLLFRVQFLQNNCTWSPPASPQKRKIINFLWGLTALIKIHGNWGRYPTKVHFLYSTPLHNMASQVFINISGIYYYIYVTYCKKYSSRGHTQVCQC